MKFQVKLIFLERIQCSGGKTEEWQRCFTREILPRIGELVILPALEESFQAKVDSVIHPLSENLDTIVCLDFANGNKFFYHSDVEEVKKKIANDQNWQKTK